MKSTGMENTSWTVVNTNQKKTLVAILISDKADFRIENYQGQRRALHNDNEVNSSRKHNNP